MAYREAIRLEPGLAEAHCNVGVLLRQGGKYAEALAALRRGHEAGSKRPDWRYPSAEWVRDCERLAALDPKLQAIVEGKAGPADAAERLDLVQIAYGKGLHALAVRLAREAFAMAPERAADLEKGQRYDAACSAVLAGCGEAKDRPLPDEPARAALRAPGRWSGSRPTWPRGPGSSRRGRSECEPGPAQAPSLEMRRRPDRRPGPGGPGQAPGWRAAELRAFWAAVDALLAKTREDPSDSSVREPSDATP